jgi:prepilin-type N-terminal cleavage/methylation domain-containing protein
MPFFLYPNNMRYKKPSQGFSLIELLVVITIFAIITSVVLFRQSKFSSDIVVSNLAYEVALEIRQAQSYGIAVKGVTDPTDPSGALLFKYAYGIHLGQGQPSDLANLKGYNPKTAFVLFADIGGSGSLANNGVYNDGENVSTFRLPGNNTIADFCYGGATSGSQCYKGGLTSLDITFIRPDPSARLHINGDASVEVVGPVTITVQSALGDKCEEITVESTGQISVNPTSISCP